MGQKKSKREAPAAGSLAARRAKRRREQERLDVSVSLSFRFGEEEGDQVTMLDDRSIPMVGSVFQYRDRIARSFALLMLRAGVTQPEVLAEILPAARWLRARQRGDDGR